MRPRGRARGQQFERGSSTGRAEAWPSALLRRTSVLAAGQNLGGLRPQARFGAQPPQRGGTWRGDGGIHFRRAFGSPEGGAGQRPAEPKKKDTTNLMFPIGTFSEPGGSLGIEADGGSRPPLCFHANNRIISSFSVICFATCRAESPSRIGVSSAPMSRYTIRTL